MKAEDLFIQAPVGITIFRGPQFVVEMANDSYMQIIDKQKEDFVGKPLFEALPEVRQNVEPLLNDVYWKGIPYHGTEFEVPLNRHGHTEITYFNFVYQPLREENVITGVIVVANDVTTQVKRKLLLQESERKFRSFLDEMPTPMLILRGEDLIIETVNKVLLEKIWRKTPEETIGKKLVDALPVMAGQRFPALLRNVFHTGEAYKEQEALVHFDYPDGKKDFYFDFEYAPLFDDLGHITGVMGTANDVTEKVLTRKRVEEAEERARLAMEAAERKVIERTVELQRANQELAIRNQELMSFNYISSHDLQEPLRKIQTFASRIQSTEAELSPENQAYLQRMQRSARQMQLLIRDLLEYSRAGQGEMAFERTDLGETLQTIRQQLLEETSTEQLSIEIGEMPILYAIPFQINQLFTNLLSNAIKFSRTSDHPLISVDVTREKGYHVIRVRDNGIGFLPEHKDQIFEVFRRLHHRTDYEGTGIGLAICKKIVENHHGRITAEGRPGEGATFTVFLPA